MEGLSMPDVKSISEVFKQDAALGNVRNFVRQAEVILLFSEIFPDLKNIAKAVKMDKGFLILRVENSIWRSELKFRQKYIIERINSYFDENIIKSIKFTA
jgi:hypothetical protein